MESPQTSDHALVSRTKSVAEWVKNYGGFGLPSRKLKADELNLVATAMASIIRERDVAVAKVNEIQTIVDQDSDTNPQVRKISEVLDE
jgi:uncharacterized protein YgfB (UPF0149 family)